MLSQTQMLHRSLSRKLGSWFGKKGGRYACPLWADNDAYTIGYLQAKGIIQQ